MTPISETTQSHPQLKRGLLLPAAYDETAMPALQLAKSSRFVRRFAKVLLVLMAISFAVISFAPWQQSVKGTGSVIAFAPTERQQTLETPIKGRIVRLGDDIYENAYVEKGQLIAEIADIDEGYLGRLESKLDVSQNQITTLTELLDASRRNLDASRTVVASFQSQLAAYQLVKTQVVAAADAAVESAKNKIEAEERQLEEQQAGLAQVEADFERQKKLYQEDIVSQLKYQDAERKLKEAQAKVSKAKAYVESAKNDLSGKQNERHAKEQKAQVDIDYAQAALDKARGDVAKAESDVAKAQSELNKARKELLDLETNVARQQSQKITAPFDGFVTQINANQGSQILKSGDPICVIVPDTADRAVQLWLDGNDAPLVEPGRHVRLQFEGWPAVQFAGWPSVAVGTFGGEVVSIDATDDGKGRFRILVRPDGNAKDWPDDRYLRQGVRANGWVLLNQVPLWYEIWRNMNGFPPVISNEAPKDKGKKPPLPKP